MKLNSFKNGAFFFLLAAFLVLAFVRWGNPFETEWLKKFNTDYKLYSLALPETVTFAGETLSLADEDMKERYDRELLTNVYWQSQTLLMIKRAAKYFPVIEPILKKQGVPDDFKYLALAESGLQPLVVSPSGAASYWQFLDKTGRAFGLTVTEEVDERYHLTKSTEAACRYFKQAYKVFGSWALVAASYNMGIEGVRRQLNMQKVSTYDELYLNQETSRYLLRIVAIKTILQEPEAHGFNVAATHLYKGIPMQLIKISATVENLLQFTEYYGCNYKDLKYYNPWLRKPRVTAAINKVYYIQLPKHKVEARLGKQVDTILHSVPSDMIDFEHEVKEGETIQIIAELYNVPVIEIRKWNRLANDEVTIGQLLRIKKLLME